MIIWLFYGKGKTAKMDLNDCNQIPHLSLKKGKLFFLLIIKSLVIKFTGLNCHKGILANRENFQINNNINFFINPSFIS